MKHITHPATLLALLPWEYISGTVLEYHTVSIRCTWHYHIESMGVLILQLSKLALVTSKTCIWHFHCLTINLWFIPTNLVLSLQVNQTDFEKWENVIRHHKGWSLLLLRVVLVTKFEYFRNGYGKTLHNSDITQHRDIWNHRQLDSFLNNLFEPTTKKMWKLSITGHM